MYASLPSITQTLVRKYIALPYECHTTHEICCCPFSTQQGGSCLSFEDHENPWVKMPDTHRAWSWCSWLCTRRRSSCCMWISCWTG